MRPTAAKIDMAKVEAAVQNYGPKPAKPKAFRELPLRPSPTAADAARRKPLTSHGDPCVGWECKAFHHND